MSEMPPQKKRPPKNPCRGQTKQGKPCKAAHLKGSLYCRAHDPHLPAESRFGSSEQAKVAATGVERKIPTLTEVLRAKVENRADEILNPLFEGLKATRGFSIALKGGGAEFFETADHATRLKAAAEIFDRLDGRPKQAQEISGPGGGPIETAGDVSRLPTDKLRELASGS